jgi:hypothetical protein
MLGSASCSKNVCDGPEKWLLLDKRTKKEKGKNKPN